jgi:ribosomal subunit interface protein
MQVLIRGHETTVQPRWRDHIYDRLSKLDRFEDRIVRIEYFLTTSHHHLKGTESCHITAKVPRKTISVKKDAATMLEAIDACSRVLERQIQTLYKDVKDRHRRAKEIRDIKRGIETYKTISKR